MWEQKQRGGKVTFFATLVITLLLWGVANGQPQGWELRVCADPNSLPFSHENETGFENRVAEILAEELGARLTYVWYYQGSAMIADQLREGGCDLIMGVPDGHRELLTTVAYYRSPYVFVYRSDSPFDIESLDDPTLQTLDIGVQNTGSSPHQALLNRDLSANVKLQDSAGYGKLGFVIEAVASKEIDVGIVWGPIGGYYTRQQPAAFKLVPVTPEVELPFLSMVLSMTIGMRPGDEALRDRLDIALVTRWEDIQAVLNAYRVPLSPLSKPVLQVGSLK